MAQNQLLKRYLDAGMQFTAMTQQRAEAIVRDLVKAGEVQAEAAQAAVNDIIERSRKNTEKLLEQVRAEVARQVALAESRTKDVVATLQAQIDELRAQLPGGRPAKKKAAKKAPAKKAAAKKAPAKKAPAKKAAAKKA
jgi:heparin binding hemagglutinin HbhA